MLLLLSGGGIGGLTLAYALSKSPDIRVDIYEAASKFTEMGAGIGMYWRTREILKSLDLEDDAIRLLTFRPGQDRGELWHATVVLDTEVFVVLSVQHRKSDQPDGLAIGALYSRGLNLDRLSIHLLDIFLSFMSRWIDGVSPRRVP